MLGDSKTPQVGPLISLCCFALAAGFGLLMVPLSARGSLPELLGSREYRTWLVLIVVQATIWIFGALYATLAWRRLSIRGLGAPGIGQLVVTSFAMLVLIVMSIYPNFIVETEFQKSASLAAPAIPLPLIAGSLTSLWVAMGIFRVHLLARSWVQQSPAEEDFRAASAQLEQLLLFLGAIIATGVLGTQASREAFFAVDQDHFLIEGEAWFLGIYWTALLAVIYLVPKNTLRRIGARMVARKIDAAYPDQDDLINRLSLEKALNESLGLEKGLVTQLQSAIGIVTPIAGAIASQLLP